NDLRPRITTWPADMIETYADDVKIIAGERMARYPLSGKRASFTRKNSADSKNDLEQLIEYLEERYTQMGIVTQRQEFTWRGIRQFNLIATIPGWDAQASKKPVLLGDHIDTAFSEQIFEASGN